MTNRRHSATTRSVPAQTSEQLLELTQEHIRPLIGVIDRLNEAGAEEEGRVISKQPARLSFRAPPPPRGRYPKEPLGPPLGRAARRHLDSERFRSTSRTCGCFRGILSLR